MSYQDKRFRTLVDDTTGVVGYKNEKTGLDVPILDIGTTNAPLLNRLRWTKNNDPRKAVIGDRIDVIAPPGKIATNIQATQNKSSTGGSASATVTGFTATPYFLQAADIPPLGADWPMAVSGNTSQEMTDFGSLANPAVEPDAPTIGTAVAGNNSITLNWTAPANNGGSAFTQIEYRLSNGNTGTATLGSTSVTVPAPNGIPVSGEVRYRNSIGPGNYSALSNSVTPASAPLSKLVTQAMSPYTLLSADNNVPLIAQPTEAAGIQIIYPTGLGATFSTSVTHDASFKAFPVEIVESGTTGKNTNGLRIKSATNQPLGFGCPLVRGPGLTATIVATAANEFTLGGKVGKWQGASHNMYPDSWSTSLQQASGRNFHRIKGKAGEKLFGVRLGFTNCYGNAEAVATADITFRASAIPSTDINAIPDLGYAPGSNTVRDVVALTGAKRKVYVDVMFATPLVYTGDWQTIQTMCWQTSSVGIIVGKGKAFDEYYNTGSGAIDRTATAYSTWGANPNNLQGGNAISSTQRFAPFTIEMITESDSIIGLGDSRSQPSNGDWPTVGDTTYLSGEVERIYGNQRPIVNLASFGDSAGNFTNSSGASSTMRRAQTYLGAHVVYGYTANDLNSSQASVLARPGVVAAMADFAGRQFFGYTIPPCIVTSTDMFTTLAGQSFSSQSLIDQNGYRVGFNNALRAGTLSPFVGYAEYADFVESARDSGKYKVAARGRTLTDVTQTNASNVYGSLLGDLGPDDVGMYFTGAIGGSGATITGIVTSVDTTAKTFTLNAYKSGLPQNAVATGTVATACYIQSCEYTQPDGNHEMQRTGTLTSAAVANSTIVVPVIPAVPANT